MLATAFAFTPYRSGDVVVAQPVVQEKTLESEVNRLSVKYQIASSTVYEVIKCESAMYGTATHKNTNGTTDHGFLQINTVHEPQMVALGLEITDQWDSLEFGFILMKSQGLKPWVYSKKCWQYKI